MHVKNPTGEVKKYLDAIGLGHLRKFKIDPKRLEFHRIEAKSQHPEDTPEEQEARAIARAAWFHHGKVAPKATPEYFADYMRSTARIVFGWMLAIFLLLLFMATRAHAQVDCIRVLSSSSTVLANYCAPFRLKEGTNVTFSVSGSTLTVNGAAGGSGTVTTFSAGTLSPLFTTSVANATSTPALTFSASSVANGNWVLASPDGASGAYGFRALVANDIPALAYLSSSTVLPATKGAVANQPLLSYDASTGLFTQGALSGSGITTLDTLSGATQTFSKTDDTNVTLTLTPAAADHNFALGWTGTLAKGRTLGTTVYTDQANTWSTGAQEIDAAVGVSGLELKDSTAATSGANPSSPSLALTGNYWTGSASASSQWTAVTTFAAGANPAASLLFSNADASGGFGNFVIFQNSTAATSGQNQAGTAMVLRGRYWNGSVSAIDSWQAWGSLGSGTNPTSTLQFTHSGSSGVAKVSVPTLNAVTGYQLNGASVSFSNTKAAVSGQPLLSYDSSTGNFTQGALTATNVGLGSVTNDAQTKAAVVPNTAPTTGQILAGNAGGTAYAPVSMSQDCTITSAGVITCTKTNNVSFAASATTNTTSATNITSGTLPAAQMPALTGECTTSAGAVSVTCGSAIAHVIASGTSTFTTTAVSASACQTTVTTSATNTLTTDAIEWTYASAPTASTDGRLTIQPYVTANNVNFMRCNNTAASVTPTAIVVNWKVLR